MDGMTREEFDIIMILQRYWIAEEAHGNNDHCRGFDNWMKAIYNATHAMEH